LEFWPGPTSDTALCRLASGLLYGVKPVVIAIILQALWKLGRSAIKGAWWAIVGLVMLFLSVVGASPLLGRARRAFSQVGYPCGPSVRPTRGGRRR
jgi:hypothetical protein